MTAPSLDDLARLARRTPAPAGSRKVRAVVRFDGPIAAPIAKGTPIGRAVVTMPDGRVIASVRPTRVFSQGLD